MTIFCFFCLDKHLDDGNIYIDVYEIHDDLQYMKVDSLFVCSDIGTIEWLFPFSFGGDGSYGNDIDYYNYDVKKDSNGNVYVSYVRFDGNLAMAEDMTSKLMLTKLTEEPVVLDELVVNIESYTSYDSDGWVGAGESFIDIYNYNDRYTFENKTDIYRTLLTLGGIPDIEYETAVLRIRSMSSGWYKESGDLLPPYNKELSLYRITSEWDVGTLSWNNQPTFSATPIATFNMLETDEYVDIVFTEEIDRIKNGGTNYGYMIKFTEETYDDELDDIWVYLTSYNNSESSIIYEYENFHSFITTSTEIHSFQSYKYEWTQSYYDSENYMGMNGYGSTSLSTALFINEENEIFIMTQALGTEPSVNTSDYSIVDYNFLFFDGRNNWNMTKIEPEQKGKYPEIQRMISSFAVENENVYVIYNSWTEEYTSINISLSVYNLQSGNMRKIETLRRLIDDLYYKYYGYGWGVNKDRIQLIKNEDALECYYTDTISNTWAYTFNTFVRLRINL